MIVPESPDGQRRKGITLSRPMTFGLGLVVLLVLMPLADFGVPWAISSLTPRYGWTEGRPGIWNLLGLVPVVVGEACMIWYIATALRHLALLPERVKLGVTPQILMTSGPYSFTRNPRYLFAGLIWTGQVLFYGSMALLIALLILWPVGILIIVPREERTLERQFGEVYLRYKATVPRWLGRRKAS
jgi:protein-S-isoprenylcysteine O-methyltransferase Ste14